MTALPKPAYVMSEPHLSGWRVVLGYETLADAQAAQSAVSAPEAREEALGNLLAVIHGDGGHRALEVGTKQAALEAEKIVANLLSSAPEAREGEEPYAWALVNAHNDVIQRRDQMHPDYNLLADDDLVSEGWEPLYTHPAAPSADKLRIDLWWNAEDWETTFDNIEDAYEAATGGYCVGVARLGRATEHDAVWAAMIDIDTTGDGEADDREIRLFATEDEARQALAALKAEG